MPRKMATTPEVKAERERARRYAKTKRLPPKASLDEQLQLGLKLMLDFMGGVDWLITLARTRPALAVQLLCKYAGKADAETEKNITYVVQQFAVQVVPTAGVLTSPIEGHIAPPRLAASNGEVIDVETTNV